MMLTKDDITALQFAQTIMAMLKAVRRPNNYHNRNSLVPLVYLENTYKIWAMGQFTSLACMS